MKKVIEIIFLKKQTPRDLMPEKLLHFPLQLRFGAKMGYEFSNGIYYSQQFSHYLFFIELIQTDMRKSCAVKLKVEEPAIFLLYIQRGALVFSGDLPDLSAGLCHLTYSSPQRYTCRLEKGLTSIFYIGIRAEWLNKHLGTFTQFTDLFKSSPQEGLQSVHLGRRMISAQMKLEFEKLFRIQKNKPVALEKNVTGICMRMLLEYQNMLVRRMASPQSDRKTVQEVQKFLLANFSDPQMGHIGDLALQFNRSRRTLMRIFQKFTGRNIHDFLMDIRIQKAIEYLEHTSLPISRISSKCGFSSANHFSRMIKRRRGLSPRDIRWKAIQKGQ